MEKGSPFRPWGLQIYGELPKNRNFRANIAISTSGSINSGKFGEGFIKAGKADKVRFYNISQGSLEECRYYLILARDLGFGDTKDLENRLEEVSKMLGSYIAKIRNDLRQS